ncbi:MAG TPA: hypothetical protein VFS24_14375 [Steroidobacteraceae bacterium]|nr:hypothetical protein [Steroidobacteraceae bacterium]
MSTAEIEVSFRGARLCVPADAAVKAWLKETSQQFAERPVESAPTVGEYWEGQGGIYAGFVRGENGDPGWHLIVPTHPSATHDSIKWGPYNVDVGVASHTDGRANTTALALLGEEYQAATWATKLEIEGHRDFYLPARRELALAEVNLADHFAKGWYWSSTQYSANSAWYQNFGDGYQPAGYKDGTGRARAVRRLQF